MTFQMLRGSIKSIKLANVVKASSLQQPIQLLNRPRHLIHIQPSALISTSKKSRDVTITADAVKAESTSSTTTTKKPWVSFGFSWRSEEEDLNTRNMIMFFTVTISMVGLSFFMAYFPDVRMRDWIQREAYIELAKREALGLPPIDENLIAPENINLPTEEELGDFKIII